MTGLFATTLALSAFLLFWVQLMSAKLILPLLGGTPAVWNTCLVFFQAVLLLGYSYAHWASRLKLTYQVGLQIGFMLVAIAFLPIQIASQDLPPTNANPSFWLLGLLCRTVGLPFFCVSTLAPLIQQWFHLRSKQERANPYKFYAASNGGSLLALIAYPTAIESQLRLSDQTWLWTGGYLGLICLVCASGFASIRVGSKNANQISGLENLPLLPDLPSSELPSQDYLESERIPNSPPKPPTGKQKWRWIVLAALPSSLLMGVTTHVTTDITPIPLLWAIPLGIYLFTFVLVFAPKPVLLNPAIATFVPTCVGLTLLSSHITGISIFLQLPLHLIAVALLMWGCHSELAKAKPDPQYLTSFYLYLALGGVLGGLFNSLLAPIAFSWLLEYPLVLVLTVFFLKFPQTRILRNLYMLQLGIMLSIAVVGLNTPRVTGHLLAQERSFFGVYRVSKVKVESQEQIVFSHGTTIHGRQSTNPQQKMEPLSYFSHSSGIGQLFAAISSKPSLRVGAVGLGVGTIAAYGKADQDWTFYEIDPLVEAIARKYFSYLSDSPAKIKVAIGDGRLTLAKADQFYDLIVLDVFSSDAIPVHLLTREAFATYLSKLAPDGAIAFHITNRYLDLAPVLGKLAENSSLIALKYRNNMSLLQPKLSDYPSTSIGNSPSTWVVLARNPSSIQSLIADSRWTKIEAPNQALWTDDYSNLFSVMSVRK
ncbi:fused MFS/spermidine synthase [Tumidithrix helvetica PCC 7403]|uniref:spermidine synthase n=1 Tax=Tumidithrix helvetica TaxID=3457545 RepID=UPI003C9EE884